MGYHHDPAKDRYWDWLHSVGRRVGFGVGFELALQAEVDVTAGVQSWVRGPHCEERLRNRPYVLFS